jgi:predicted Fe-Mo cluster-binding NifX family protein
MDLHQAPPVGREVQVGATTIAERAQELLHLGIGVIICGALSDQLFIYLQGEGLHLICGIAGDVDAVVAAYQDGTLARACFRMPGSGLREQSET